MTDATLRGALRRLYTIRATAEVKAEGTEDFLMVSHGDLVDLEEQLMNANAQHTPGPWRVERSRISRTDFIIMTGNDPLPICSGLTEADAHLIAAAPELYAAVKEVLRFFWQDQDNDGEEPAQLRAALVKARGGEEGEEGET